MKYALHPGHVTASDGDVHYIGVMQLVELYRLEPGSWVVWGLGMRDADFVHLYPRGDGNYELRARDDRLAPGRHDLDSGSDRR